MPSSSPPPSNIPSLKIAAAAIKSGTKAQLQTGIGVFEDEFAGALDFSEFSSKGTQSNASASSDLLKIKAKERQQRDLEELEEEELEVSIQKRVSSVRATLQSPRGTRSRPNLVVENLWTMHDIDKADPRYTSRKRKSKNQRQKNPSKGATKKGRIVIKKGRKSKF